MSLPLPTVSLVACFTDLPFLDISFGVSQLVEFSLWLLPQEVILRFACTEVAVVTFATMFP